MGPTKYLSSLVKYYSVNLKTPNVFQPSPINTVFEVGKSNTFK